MTDTNEDFFDYQGDITPEELPGILEELRDEYPALNWSGDWHPDWNTHGEFYIYGKARYGQNAYRDDWDRGVIEVKFVLEHRVGQDYWQGTLTVSVPPVVASGMAHRHMKRGGSPLQIANELVDSWEESGDDTFRENLQSTQALLTAAKKHLSVFDDDLGIDTESGDAVDALAQKTGGEWTSSTIEIDIYEHENAVIKSRDEGVEIFFDTGDVIQVNDLDEAVAVLGEMFGEDEEG